ncbi:type IV pilus biogenesis protein PilP [Glaciimonas sp. GG7]
MYNHKCVLMAAAMAASFSANTALAVENTAEQLQQLSQSRAIWAARKADEDMRGQYLEKKAAADRFFPDASAMSTQDGNASAPVVYGIEGIDDKLSATLLFAGGVRQTVKRGDKIRGGWRVQQVTINSVALARGKENLILAFGEEAPRQPVAPAGLQFRLPDASGVLPLLPGR